MKMWKQIAMGVTVAFVLGIGAVSVIPPVTHAAPSGATIGFVDYIQVKSNMVDYKNAQATMAAEQEKLQKEFDEKSASLSDAEKKQLYNQYMQRLNQKATELDTQMNEKIDAAIKDIATKQGISVVLDKSSVLYGGKDLTQDVINKLK